MRWSKSFLFTLKDAPSDAEIPSHRLMVRAGLVRKVAPGIFTYSNLMLRALRKLESIIRTELDSRGCEEILMPMVHPQALWEETGRWKSMGEGLLKFRNRNDHGFCLGATHEEVVTDFVRRDVRSYRDLPVNLYQIQTKYRDEMRPRFGLMRGREFSMKDAYSFDSDRDAALKSYENMYAAYRGIFDSVGLEYRIVQADAGQIGGSQTHEFQVLAAAGEDHLMVCDSCDYAANIEVAPASVGLMEAPRGQGPMEEFATPGLKTIEQLAQQLQVPESELVKTLFYSSSEPGSGDQELKPVAVLLRGDDELNPVKLKNALGLVNPPLMLTDAEVQKVTGAWPGSCGPQGLSIPIYVDKRVLELPSYIVGANRDGFHVRSVVLGRDFEPAGTADLRMAKAGDRCPSCQGGKYQSMRGIEVGHVFYLGTKYSEAMRATFLSAEGQPRPIEMGCYGIGVTRTVQAAIEQSHDSDGIIWPKALAPFDVHVCLLDPKDPRVSEIFENLVSQLEREGLAVFVDDRDERPGVKFKDADLLGFPVRVVLGGKGVTANQIEVVVRRTKEKSVHGREELASRVGQLWRELPR